MPITRYRTTHGQPTTSTGFTLVELMIVVALLGIFASIALPNFAQFIKNNRTQSASDELYSLFQYARANAVANRSQMSVCIANGVWSVQQFCDKATPAAVRTFTPPQRVLAASTATTMVFHNNGTSTKTGITVCGDDSVAANGYTITISNTGQIRTFARGKKNTAGDAMSDCQAVAP